jgi:hypothetical protein
VNRFESNDQGDFLMTLDSGSYNLEFRAQGYEDFPQAFSATFSLTVLPKQSWSDTIYLAANTQKGNLIKGSVLSDLEKPVPGAMVLLEGAKFGTHSAITDSLGEFSLWNIQDSNFSIKTYKSGYESYFSDEKLSSEALDLTLKQINSISLEGQVSFLASNNGIVDITLLDLESRLPIAGYSKKCDESGNYQLDSLPTGSFIVWASFENDGYVMDPDRIAKFGEDTLVVRASDSSHSIDFDVTGAVSLISPTNTAELIVPDTLSLEEAVTFSWEKYSSASGYYIEVTELSGKEIWGGLPTDVNGTYPIILAETESVVFNFDKTASQELQAGESYRWKLYSYKDDKKSEQGRKLISMSEDFKGYFILK